jgi:hypothetical protein
MTALVAVVAVAVVCWFAAGTIWNVRRGRELMLWMQGGLSVLGERTTARWLGSTAVEMVIRQAKPPFEQVTVIIFLEPRDMPWMWALSRWRGRRDTVILRGHLRRQPRSELEVLDPGSWSGRDALRRMPPAEWSVRRPTSPGALPTWFRGPSALERADDLVALAGRAGLSVRRLSIRRTEPHFQLHLAPPGAAASPSAFFEAVRALGERAPA